MPEYYCDEQKFALRVKDPICYDLQDDEAQQSIGVQELVSGVIVTPGKRWSPLCKKLFLKEKANGMRLGSRWRSWGGDLSIVNDLPQCKDLTVGYDSMMDFSVLAGNPNIESLQLDYFGSGDPGEFDLASLPNLKRCQIPAHRNFMSVVNCSGLVSLAFCNGKCDGVLGLDVLANLEELICVSVSKLKGVKLNPKVRLRALKLSSLKLFETIQPLDSVVEELRIVTLDKLPRFKIEWLAQAYKAECIALRVGEIPSIQFLKGLKNLQVLDLFGSKVLDGDLSVRKALKQQLDDKSWGNRQS